MYTHIYTYTHIHIYTYTHIHIYTCTHIHIYAYTHIHIHIYIYIYTDMHVYIYIYIYREREILRPWRTGSRCLRLLSWVALAQGKRQYVIVQKKWRSEKDWMIQKSSSHFSSPTGPLHLRQWGATRCYIGRFARDANEETAAAVRCDMVLHRCCCARHPKHKI